MIGMQYKITLPEIFNMEIIKERVRNNGHKTDGFEGLFFKCYLIKEKGEHSMENMYAPLYIWKSSEGMNKFLFEGYYDNILQSFGWQHVNIGIPVLTEFTKNFSDSKYMVEETGDIIPESSLTGFQEAVRNRKAADEDFTARICIYNPDKWKFSMFYFYEKFPAVENDIYQILHISH